MLPTGCPGLKQFTADRFEHRRRGHRNTWSGVDSKDVTQCPKQKLAPEGTALSEIFEEYADDQAAWVDDFVPALEKMLANGYASSELTEPSFDQWTSVVCPEQ